MSTKSGKPKKTPRSIAKFYDLLAPDYDLMTGFEDRFAREKPLFQELVRRYGIERALDAGCGTGFHSLLLAQLGVRVTAADLSAEMLQLARANARQYNAKLRTLQGSFRKLDRLIKYRFDAVFVMGNSLAHLLSKSALKSALQSLSNLVKPGGILFSQSLNYERILANRESIQSAKEIGKKKFERYYEYDATGILFHIRTVDQTEGMLQEKDETIRLRPVLRKELCQLLEKVGFDEVNAFGGISLELYDPGASRDLIVLARKRK